MLGQAAIASIALLLSGGLAPQPGPDPAWVRNLCAAVESQSVQLNPSPSYIRYNYESQLAVAAGVISTDTRETAHRKIGAYLDENMPYLLCNQFNFNPRNGNILKLAVAKNSGSFIRAALQDWRIRQLNQVDATDGKTVLDFIQDRRAAAGESSLGRTLSRYYEQFRAAGALHASELAQ